jgi:hypothetical protein
LSLTAGVAVGAMTLHLTQAIAGAELGPADFAPAFLVVAALAALSALIFLRLPADAGAELAGRRSVQVRATLTHHGSWKT